MFGLYVLPMPTREGPLGTRLAIVGGVRGCTVQRTWPASRPPTGPYPEWRWAS